MANFAAMPRSVPVLTIILFSICKTASGADGTLLPGDPNGAEIYQQKCQMCHQAGGVGVPGVFPPLAGSDWLVNERERVMKALCEGVQGKIRVNGMDYDGAMPAQILDDTEAAAVLNYIGQTWGNSAAAFTKEAIAAVRTKSKFPTYPQLVAASQYAPLPQPPAGLAVREISRLPDGPDFGTRLAGDARGVFILANTGRVWQLDLATGGLVDVLKPADYLDLSRGGVTALGLMRSADGALWVVTNQQIANPEQAGGAPLNEVVIHRSAPFTDAAKIGPMQKWFTHHYPHGGGMNHGVSHLAIGPDGLLYVASGSRTDGGEKSKIHADAPTGEVDTTACIWRLDPKSTAPKLEVIARGIRNAYGFAWDGSGHLFTVANGPDANAPEEMDYIQPGHHYGFPYQFSDWPITPKPYPHTPDAPAGLTFDLPVKNFGPAGGGTASGLSTFDAHSSPAGIVWCGSNFPEPLRERFLVTRYGNLLGEARTGNASDVGFDVLSMKMTATADGKWTARTESILAPLGRPIDALALASGKVLILEYTRPTDFKNSLGWLPGRVIELSASGK